MVQLHAQISYIGKFMNINFLSLIFYPIDRILNIINLLFQLNFLLSQVKNLLLKWAFTLKLILSPFEEVFGRWRLQLLEIYILHNIFNHLEKLDMGVFRQYLLEDVHLNKFVISYLNFTGALALKLIVEYVPIVN